MAPSECLDDGIQAKPASAMSSLQYHYACTLKPNSKLEQNNKDIMDLVFDQLFGAKVTQDLKYEMDSKGVLHLHFTMVSDVKLRSYYPFFRKGWHVHVSLIKDKLALCRWKHYLTKGDPNDQVLIMAQARTSYLFQ